MLAACLQMSMKAGQPQGWVLFASHWHACQARDAIAGTPFEVQPSPPTLPSPAPTHLATAPADTAAAAAAAEPGVADGIPAAGRSQQLQQQTQQGQQAQHVRQGGGGGAGDEAGTARPGDVPPIKAGPEGMYTSEAAGGSKGVSAGDMLVVAGDELGRGPDTAGTAAGTAAAGTAAAAALPLLNRVPVAAEAPASAKASTEDSDLGKDVREDSRRTSIDSSAR